MEYLITQYDIKLMYQKVINFYLKIEVLKDDGKTILDVLKGTIVGGTSTIDSMSSVRRTFSATIIPTLFDRNDAKISENGLVWLNKEIRLYVGIYDIHKKDYIYYPQGCYIYTNTSGVYDAVTNQLTINCSDFINKLNGTKNGQLGGLTTLIPAYEENETTGDVIKRNVIRDVMITVLTQLGNIKNYLIDDIGEFKAMPNYNIYWQQYRKEHELWNKVPHDLEFSSDCTVFQILEKIVNLYPNYEMYFDIYNTFICSMIPSCYNDDIIFSNDFLQMLYISEQTSIDMLKVRNICEVWGKVIDADFFTEKCSYKNNIYSGLVEGYEKYYNGDLIAIKIPSLNKANSKLKINNLENIDILDENTDKSIQANSVSSGNVFVFKIKTKRINNETKYYAYLLGHWQAHGMNILTDGSLGDNFTFEDGTITKKFSKEYFQKKYNCESVEFEIIKDSPFTVQKLGEILDKKSGGEFENITSDSLALSRAKWENWKNCRLTESLTLTTNLVPFYDVNVKVTYKHHNSNQEQQYIIKSVSHDYSSGTSTLSLMKFYPLYDESIKEENN